VCVVSGYVRSVESRNEKTGETEEKFSSPTHSFAAVSHPLIWLAMGRVLWLL